MLLAIDTATRVASIALYDAEGVRGEWSWTVRENHTTSLMPEIVHLLALTRTTFGDLQGIAACLGPGSFTGLRVGLSVAKGLAVTRHLPIVGVPTFEAMAAAEREERHALCAVIDAGRKRWAAALFFPQDGRWEQVGEYFIGRTEALIPWVRERAPDALFTGELTQAAISELCAAWPEARVAPPAARLRRAGYVAELAWERLALGRTDDLLTLAPYYIPTESVPASLSK